MPSGGHNAKPDAVLKLHGGYRKDLHAGRGPVQGGESLQKPDGLPELASWLWDQVALHRAAWLCSSDAPALETLCRSYSYARACDALLQEDATNKDARCSRSSYVSEFNSLAARFGLTPADRARLGEDKPLRDKNQELEDMLA